MQWTVSIRQAIDLYYIYSRVNGDSREVIHGLLLRGESILSSTSTASYIIPAIGPQRTAGDFEQLAGNRGH